jgi:hypothetical protein
MNGHGLPRAIALGSDHGGHGHLAYPALRRLPSRVAYFQQFIRPIRNDLTVSSTTSPPTQLQKQQLPHDHGPDLSPWIALLATAAARGLRPQSMTALIFDDAHLFDGTDDARWRMTPDNDDDHSRC